MIADKVCGVRVTKTLAKKIDKEAKRRKVRGRSACIRAIIIEHFEAQEPPKP